MATDGIRFTEQEMERQRYANEIHELQRDKQEVENQRDHLESLLAVAVAERDVAVGALRHILQADLRWAANNWPTESKQARREQSIASLLRITGLTQEQFAALRIGD